MMMIKNKAILITGAAGFIGGHLFETLIKENNYIVVIDNFHDYYSGKEENFKELTKNYEISKDYKLIKGDLLDKSVYNKINCDIDIIFHLAAQPGVRYSIEHAAEVTNNNIVSTVNILEYSVHHNIKKLVYASSSSVYGNPVYTPLDEEHPKNPISPYAVSKLAGEIYADLYFREYTLPVTSLRFYTVYGERGRPDMAIRKFFNLILQDKEIIVYGDGEQLRDFTYVSDIINGLILAAENDNSIGEVFNLGVGSPITVNNLIDKMYSLANRPKNVKYIEKQQGDVDITYSNTEKAKKVLSFNPKVNIDDGLRRTYEWLE
ncbi:MAG: NAD-dependent epimerase/dehydratase family protein [Promethearchaeota archaeon]|nr:MAG: NAD-dependent epimerase/dehydratase family protein [Candidatus Lokiarchaeota archaeon]